MLIERVKLADALNTTALALCDEMWAIHPSGTDPETGDQLYALTHRATGHAAAVVTWAYSLQLLNAIRKRPAEMFDFTDPEAARALKDEWKAIKAEAKAAVGGIWLEDGK